MDMYLFTIYTDEKHHTMDALRTYHRGMTFFTPLMAKEMVEQGILVRNAAEMATVANMLIAASHSVRNAGFAMYFNVSKYEQATPVLYAEAVARTLSSDNKRPE